MALPKFRLSFFLEHDRITPPLRFEPEMIHSYDFIVIGSGIAGLTFALKVAPYGTVAILTKKNRAESNTNYAQGGIACVFSAEDSFALHIRDTLQAGAGLCKENIVREIVEEAPERIRELIESGMEFSHKENSPDFDLGQEGGHSRRRILHSKDMTGKAIEQTLLSNLAKHPNIRIFENYVAVDLITLRKLGYCTRNACLGVYVLNKKTREVETFASRHLLLATGGCGQTYLHTTNPEIATGDGVAMAYRAGVPVANMEFIQFHPTCLYHPDGRSFLISEAVRGEGGILIDAQGREFMERYHPMKSLAPRDVVARAIDAEMKKSGAPCVYLDIRSKGETYLRERFPQIFSTCLKYGIRMHEDPIPVVPAAHYQCGGIQTDLDGRTVLPGLWAAGEVACTGLHGANRLASNSLLEALVVSHRASKAIAADTTPPSTIELQPWQTGNADDPDEMVVVKHLWQEIRQLMWNYVGIVRSDKRLYRASTRLRMLTQEIHEYYWDHKLTPELIDLRNIAVVASLVVDSAISRKESRGLHSTLDYPETRPELATTDTILHPPG